jgi:hypothetical protein
MLGLRRGCGFGDALLFFFLARRYVGLVVLVILREGRLAQSTHHKHKQKHEQDAHGGHTIILPGSAVGAQTWAEAALTHGKNIKGRQRSDGL